MLVHIIPSEARSLLGLGRDRMASMAISCVDFKTSPFLVNLNAGFFSAANNVKHGFLSSGTFTGATCYSIAELNSHVELFHACLLKLRPSS